MIQRWQDCSAAPQATRKARIPIADGYRALRIGAGTKALEEQEYPNQRSELWFAVAEMARAYELDLSRLLNVVQEDIRWQRMGMTLDLFGILTTEVAEPQSLS
jgi:hypothetical protein